MKKLKFLLRVVATGLLSSLAAPAVYALMCVPYLPYSPLQWKVFLYFASLLWVLNISYVLFSAIPFALLAYKRGFRGSGLWAPVVGLISGAIFGLIGLYIQGSVLNFSVLLNRVGIPALVGVFTGCFYCWCWRNYSWPVKE